MAIKRKATPTKEAALKPKKVEAVKKVSESIKQVDMTLMAKTVSDAVDKAINRGMAETRLIAEAISKKPVSQPEVQIVQNAAPPIKTIKVTNISRCSRGLIKDLDMKVERESIH